MMNWKQELGDVEELAIYKRRCFGSSFTQSVPKRTSNFLSLGVGCLIKKLWSFLITFISAIMANSSNRHWPSMFKSKPCNTTLRQWQHDVNSPLISSGACHRTPYTSGIQTFAPFWFRNCMIISLVFSNFNQYIYIYGFGLNNWMFFFTFYIWSLVWIISCMATRKLFQESRKIFIVYKWILLIMIHL